MLPSLMAVVAAALALPTPRPHTAGEPPAPVFVDQALASGIDFTHFNGMTGNFTIAEITGQGAGLLDYDGDGDLDVYLVQGRLLGERMSEALFPWKRAGVPLDRLYRNDLRVAADGSRVLHFEDVTEASGIRCDGYGMGVATGDYDGDGRVDIYVTNLGPNRLYRNRGDGTFEDATEKAHADDPRWSTGASFLDYDRDGDLDLYVANYVDFETDPTRKCYANTSARDFCGPAAYRPVPDRLLRNNGDGTFEDVSTAAGIHREYGSGFGVVAADFNGDGWLDVYVGNDGDPNQLWINQRDGTFKNEALLGGAAVNALGRPEASMGVDAEDFDGDGDWDIVMTHIMEETNTLFVNDGTGVFEDASLLSGIAAPSRGMTGFGPGWLDFDNDGLLDLIVLNGEVRVIPELARAGDPYPLGQPNQLLRNMGGGKLEPVGERAGPAFSLIEVSRAAALGDVDNDGDTDVLQANNNGPARLLINQLGNRNHWLGLRLLTGDPPRDALGARIEVQLAGGTSLWRRARGDGGYCSARDPRVLVGLGGREEVEALRVLWPDGTLETWPGMRADRYVTLRQGSAPRDE